MPKFNKPVTVDEIYLVSIADIFENKMFYVLAPCRKDCSQMLLSLSTKRYAVMGVTLINNLRKFEEFMKELIDDQKPNGLCFGDK